MICYPRSYYTAVIPKPTTVGDNFLDFPYFDSIPTGIEFFLPNTDTLYVYRNPVNVLSQMVRTSVTGTGLSDLDFNFAIAQNTEGAYTIRGRCTKCQETDSIKVLLLVGNNEAHTDQLKENAKAFSLSDLIPKRPDSPLNPGDRDVHVFDLIEYLAYEGLYEGRNDGFYGPFVERAVKKLQLKLDEPVLDGIWNYSLINKLQRGDREYIVVPTDGP